MDIRNDLKLYAVTDRAWLNGKSVAQQVEEAIKGGVTMIQLREKELDDEAFEAEALEVQKVCRAYHVPFLINDNVALAKKIDADGVHVGQDDMQAGAVRELLGPDKIIGVTAKTIEQARFALKNGADYLGSGAVFGSSTKKDAKAMTLDRFQEICESVPIPVVAIGGISKENLMQLKGRKMAGAAIVSGIFAQENIEEASKELRMMVEELLESEEGK